MLVPGVLANKFKAFVLELNQTKQKDKESAIDRFCKELESEVYTANKSITITIPSGAIILTGANSGGPVVCTNTAPIILNKVVT